MIDVPIGMLLDASVGLFKHFHARAKGERSDWAGFSAGWHQPVGDAVRAECTFANQAQGLIPFESRYAERATILTITTADTFVSVVHYGSGLCFA
jgi:hypothetical protein